MNKRFFPLGAGCGLGSARCSRAGAPAARVVDLATPDGTTLKATYFAASKAVVGSDVVSPVQP